MKWQICLAAVLIILVGEYSALRSLKAEAPRGLQVSSNLTHSLIKTNVTIENPSLFPAIVTDIRYSVSLSGKELASGSSGVAMIMPFSKKIVAVDAEVEHLKAASSLGSAALDLILGKSPEFNVSAMPVLFGMQMQNLYIA